MVNSKLSLDSGVRNEVTDIEVEEYMHRWHELLGDRLERIRRVHHG
jgi:hypothetical protein